MRWSTCLLALLLLLPHCSRRRTGPSPADLYELYKERFQSAEALEDEGKRYDAIRDYEEAKEALEALDVTYPKSMYFEEKDLARVKDVIRHLKDEERRGVEAVIAGQEGPPPVPEPEMTGELYDSIRRGIETKIGAETNDKLKRVKRVEPDVVDHTPALVIHVLTNSRLIEGMMVEQVKGELKEVLRVVRAHQEELDSYKIYLIAGYKAIEGAGGYAEPVLLAEYRFTPAAFQKIDWEKLESDEGKISDFATSFKEP